MNWQEPIVSTPNVSKGKPRMNRTRIPVGLILGSLARGATTDDLQREVPDVTPHDVAACLSYPQDFSKFAIAASCASSQTSTCQTHSHHD